MIEILSVDNKSYSMNDIPEDVDDNMQFGIIDYTEEDTVDYQFIPLLFMETFTMTAIELMIDDKYTVKVPADWSIVIGDQFSGDLEVIEVKKMTNRSFEAFVFNPISGFYPKFKKVEISYIYPDIRWYLPKLKTSHLLVSPIEKGSNPDCVFVVKETNKLPDILDLGQLV